MKRSRLPWATARPIWRVLPVRMSYRPPNTSPRWGPMLNSPPLPPKYPPVAVRVCPLRISRKGDPPGGCPTWASAGVQVIANSPSVLIPSAARDLRRQSLINRTPAGRGRSSPAAVRSPGDPRTVGATSRSAPPGRRNWLFGRIATSGTGFMVWAVCTPPVTGSIIISQLPWSAVMRTLGPHFLGTLENPAETLVHDFNRPDHRR